MKERRLTHDNEYKGMDVLQFKKQNVGLDKDILECIYDRMTDMLSRHSKVYAMRFDVKQPEQIPDTSNQWFSEFQAHFVKKEKRAGYDPSYVAVREVTESGRPHYHEYLMVDGNKTEKIHEHIKNANEAMNCTLGIPKDERTGLINDCTRNRKGVRQDNGEQINLKTWLGRDACQASFRQASYLAKESQKEPQKGVRELFASQVKMNSKKNT